MTPHQINQKPKILAFLYLGTQIKTLSASVMYRCLLAHSVYSRREQRDSCSSSWYMQNVLAGHWRCSSSHTPHGWVDGNCIPPPPPPPETPGSSPVQPASCKCPLSCCRSTLSDTRRGTGLNRPRQNLIAFAENVLIASVVLLLELSFLLNLSCIKASCSNVTLDLYQSEISSIQISPFSSNYIFYMLQQAGNAIRKVNISFEPYHLFNIWILHYFKQYLNAKVKLLSDHSLQKLSLSWNIYVENNLSNTIVIYDPEVRIPLFLNWIF